MGWWGERLQVTWGQPNAALKAKEDAIEVTIESVYQREIDYYNKEIEHDQSMVDSYQKKLKDNTTKRDAYILALNNLDKKHNDIKRIEHIK